MDFAGCGPVFGETLAASTASSKMLQDQGPSCLDVLTLPSGFPSSYNERLAWTGADFKQESSYVYELTESDAADIKQALAHFKSLEFDGDCVNMQTFPLPHLGPKLNQLSEEIHHGKGFAVIRGIDVKHHSVEDLMLVYLGVQSYIADERGRQDKRGNILVHIVADTSTKQRADHHRHSNKSITFHNEESGDIISWLTRGTAENGGKCILASCYAIYNILAAHRPDLLRLLVKSDWPFALPTLHSRPVMFVEKSNLITNFGRAALLGNAAHPRSRHLPSLTARQVEALDVVEAIARGTELQISTQPGDMHFVNNLAILHRREEFVDGGLHKRHLVRMRLRSSRRGWTIPAQLQREWRDAFEGDANQEWHLEPMPDAFFPLRKYPN